MNPSFIARPTDKELFRTVARLAKKKKIRLYLVGGYLRDIFLKRQKQNPDLDFCLEKGAISFGRFAAREMKAGFVVLDREHGSCRVVKKAKERIYTLDFTDFRGRTLEEDLLRRDFTINALCGELDRLFPWFSHKEEVLSAKKFNGLLIDPYSARKDLALRIIRQVDDRAFDEDPLRILRAFSLASIFGFKIDKATLQAARRKAGYLSGVSYERIRDELFKILDRPGAFGYLVKMDEMKILKTIIPEIEKMRGVAQGPYHHLDVWKHSLETVRQLELIIEELKNNRNVQGYLGEFLCGERRRLALIKLGALLHDIGKPDALRHEDGKTKFHGHERIGMEISGNIAQRLRLSNDELDALKKMILWHLRPGYLADSEEVSQRARFRYFRDTAREGISVLLLSLADQRATKGPLTSEESRLRHEEVVLRLLKEYFRKQKEKKLARLVNGDDLLRHFKLTPSPLIGKILAELEESQAIGRIKTRKQALEAARRYIKG